jgi:hypothetical protein
MMRSPLRIVAAAFWLARADAAGGDRLVLAFATKLVPIFQRRSSLSGAQARPVHRSAVLVALYLPALDRSCRSAPVPNVVDRVRFNGPLLRPSRR